MDNETVLREAEMRRVFRELAPEYRRELLSQAVDYHQAKNGSPGELGRSLLDAELWLRHISYAGTAGM